MQVAASLARTRLTMSLRLPSNSRTRHMSGYFESGSTPINGRVEPLRQSLSPLQDRSSGPKNFMLRARAPSSCATQPRDLANVESLLGFTFEDGLVLQAIIAGEAAH